MFNNNLNLTDDELSAIQTALLMTIQGYEKHVKLHGEQSLDIDTIQGIRDMKKLFDRFNDEYFEYKTQ